MARITQRKAGKLSKGAPAKRETAKEPGPGPGRVERPSPGPGRVERVKQTINGSASVVFMFYGDNNTQTLFQETLRLIKAFEGYDRKVLLKHQHTPSWLDFSEADEQAADIIVPPTTENLKAQIADLANSGFMIDLYIFSHGLTGRFTTSSGAHDDPTDSFTASDVSDIQQMIDFNFVPLRMVYQVPCYGSSLNEEWRRIGAKVTAGPRGVIFTPQQFGKFIDDWNDGSTSFRQSALEAETAFMRTAGQLYIQGDALKTRPDWGGCPFGQTVLGKHSCAESYFNFTWYDPGEWQAGMSGKQNMNFSSKMIVSGSSTITKSSQPDWY